MALRHAVVLFEYEAWFCHSTEENIEGFKLLLSGVDTR
jgi:hypothetical protein